MGSSHKTSACGLGIPDFIVAPSAAIMSTEEPKRKAAARWCRHGGFPHRWRRWQRENNPPVEVAASSVKKVAIKLADATMKDVEASENSIATSLKPLKIDTDPSTPTRLAIPRICPSRNVFPAAAHLVIEL